MATRYDAPAPAADARRRMLEGGIVSPGTQVTATTAAAQAVVQAAQAEARVVVARAAADRATSPVRNPHACGVLPASPVGLCHERRRGDAVGVFSPIPVSETLGYQLLPPHPIGPPLPPPLTLHRRIEAPLQPPPPVPSDTVDAPLLPLPMPSAALPLAVPNPPPMQIPALAPLPRAPSAALPPVVPVVHGVPTGARGARAANDPTALSRSASLPKCGGSPMQSAAKSIEKAQSVSDAPQGAAGSLAAKTGGTANHTVSSISYSASLGLTASRHGESTSSKGLGSRAVTSGYAVGSSVTSGGGDGEGHMEQGGEPCSMFEVTGRSEGIKVPMVQSLWAATETSASISSAAALHDAAPQAASAKGLSVRWQSQQTSTGTSVHSARGPDEGGAGSAASAATPAGVTSASIGGLDDTRSPGDPSSGEEILGTTGVSAAGDTYGRLRACAASALDDVGTPQSHHSGGKDPATPLTPTSQKQEGLLCTSTGSTAKAIDDYMRQSVPAQHSQRSVRSTSPSQLPGSVPGSAYGRASQKHVSVVGSSICGDNDAYGQRSVPGSGYGHGMARAFMSTTLHSSSAAGRPEQTPAESMGGGSESRWGQEVAGIPQEGLTSTPYPSSRCMKGGTQDGDAAASTLRSSGGASGCLSAQQSVPMSGDTPKESQPQSVSQRASFTSASTWGGVSLGAKPSGVASTPGADPKAEDEVLATAPQGGSFDHRASQRLFDSAECLQRMWQEDAAGARAEQAQGQGSGTLLDTAVVNALLHTTVGADGALPRHLQLEALEHFFRARKEEERGRLRAAYPKPQRGVPAVLADVTRWSSAATALSLSARYLPPAAWGALLRVSRLTRQLVQRRFDPASVVAVMNVLDVQYRCAPLFLAADAVHPARNIALMTGVWDGAAPPHPPAGALFIPFSGGIMSSLWNTILPRTARVPPYSWATLSSPADVRRFLSKCLQFHSDDLRALPPAARTEAVDLWSVLGAVLSAMTSSHRFHALYIQTDPYPEAHYAQLNLLLHEPL